MATRTVPLFLSFDRIDPATRPCDVIRPNRAPGGPDSNRGRPPGRAWRLVALAVAWYLALIAALALLDRLSPRDPADPLPRRSGPAEGSARHQ